MKTFQVLITKSELSGGDTKYLIHPSDELWQVGAYFGHSVLGFDINDDGLDDLMVSAPLYFTRGGFDQGRVFVFMNDPANPGPVTWVSNFKMLFKPLP